MRVIHHLQTTITEWTACVGTLGNFDGMHLGHQAILESLQHLSKQYQLPSLVIIFEPQPQEFLGHNPCPARLMTLREKLLAFERYGVDTVFVAPFRESFAQLSPADFVQHILVERLHMQHIVVGEDVRFGYQGAGDLSYLQAVALQWEFIVDCAPLVQIRDDQQCLRRVSSTWLRQALATGDLKRVQQLLGHPYGMCGRVVRGDGMGSKIGFPTANVHLNRCQAALHGVFVVKVDGVGQTSRYGVANIGHRPTVDGKKCVLEVHLLDFHERIYRQYISIHFLHRLRDEMLFDSVELLAQQIRRDVLAGRRFLRGYDGV